MNMDSSFFPYLQIVLYGFIGYFTNWLALKMLFFPYAEKKIGKTPLPFTPGLIPKERERLANSIGKVVSNRLLTKADLNDAITDLELNKKIAAAVIDVLREKFFDKFNDEGKDLSEIFMRNFFKTKFAHCHTMIRKILYLFVFF